MVKYIAALVFLITLGITLYVFTKDSEVKTSDPNSRSIEPISTNCVDKIAITKNLGPGRESETIILEKQNSEWKMTRPIKCLVNLALVQNMLDSLKGLKTIAVVSENKDQLSKFELQEGRGIDVEVFCGKKSLAHLTIGTAKINITFLKKHESDEVYQVAGPLRATFNKTVKMLRDRNIFDIDKVRISRVKYSNQTGELTLLKKDTPGSLTYEPSGIKIQNFNNNRAIKSIGVLAKLNARDFVDEPIESSVTGLDESASKVEFDIVEKGTSTTNVLWIGKEFEKMRQTYVKTSRDDQVFLISSHFVKSLSLTADDLARTHEQVKEEEEMRRKAAEHAHEHHHHGPKKE